MSRLEAKIQGNSLSETADVPTPFSELHYRRGSNSNTYSRYNSHVRSIPLQLCFSSLPQGAAVRHRLTLNLSFISATIKVHSVATFLCLCALGHQLGHIPDLPHLFVMRRVTRDRCSSHEKRLSSGSSVSSTRCTPSSMAAASNVEPISAAALTKDLEVRRILSTRL